MATTQKAEKPKFDSEKNRKIVFGSIISVLIVGFIVAISIILYKFLPQKALDAPKYAQIITSGDSTFVQVEANRKAKKYIYYINSGALQIESDKNVLEISKYLSEPNYYTVQVACVGRKSESKSPLSSTISFTKTEELVSPIINFIDSEKTGINWTPVENAQKYIVNYNNETQTIFGTSFLFSNLDKAGQYSFQVIAISTQSKYVDSKPSNVIIYDKQIQLNAPSVSGAGGRITISSVENAISYDIQIGSKTYSIPAFNGTTTFDPRLFDEYFDSSIPYEAKVKAKGNGYWIDSLETIYNYPGM